MPVRWAQRSAMMCNMKELSQQYQCDGLSVYGAALRCGAQLLVLELVKLVLTPRVKRRCKEFQLETLVEDVARVEQLATTYRISGTQQPSLILPRHRQMHTSFHCSFGMTPGWRNC
jgi:hypothetical protein